MTKDNSVLIIDYGLGNLNSVMRGVLAAGGKPYISQNPQDLKNAQKAILPGVGAFAAGMEGLAKRNFESAIAQYVEAKKELLGLCLGMQLLFTKSEEFGVHAGLGFMAGTVKLLSPKKKDTYKIPHVSWNSLSMPEGVSWKTTILEDIKEGDMVYFVHSYAPPVSKDTLAQTEYGGVVLCTVGEKDNVTGTQFHPEKSAQVGQKILKRFIEK